MIERIQRRLGIDVRHYLSGGFYLGISQAVPLVLLFLSTWFLTHFLSKDDYGAYNYIQSLLGMLIVFTLPGYYNAVLRSAARGFHGALLASVKRRMAFSLLGTLILIGMGVWYFSQGDPVRAKGCLAGSLFLGMVYGLDDFRAFLNGQKDYKTYAAYNIGLQAVVTTATVSALLLSENFLVVLLVNLASRGFGQLVCVIHAVSRRENSEVEEGFTAFGNRLSAYSALGTISFYLDRVVVGTFFSLETMAEYGLASTLTNPLRNIGVIVNRLTFPKMVNLKGREFAKKTFNKGFLLLAILVAIGILFYFVLYLVLYFLFPKYLNIRPYADLMLVSELVSVYIIYLETYYLSQDRMHRVYYFVNVARPVLMILLLYPFIQWWGLFGAILSKLVVRAGEGVYLMARIGMGMDDYEEGAFRGQTRSDA